MLPVERFCDDMRRVIGEDLMQMGLLHVCDRRFRVDSRDDHAVCLYHGHGHLVAIAWSLEDGVLFSLTSDLEADVAKYPTWANLWEWLDEHASHEWKQDFDKVFEPVPADHIEVLRLMAAGLREFFVRT